MKALNFLIKKRTLTMFNHLSFAKPICFCCDIRNSREIKLKKFLSAWQFNFTQNQTPDFFVKWKSLAPQKQEGVFLNKTLYISNSYVVHSNKSHTDVLSKISGVAGNDPVCFSPAIFLPHHLTFSTAFKFIPVGIVRCLRRMGIAFKNDGDRFLKWVSRFRRKHMTFICLVLLSFGCCQSGLAEPRNGSLVSPINMKQSITSLNHQPSVQPFHSSPKALLFISFSMPNNVLKTLLQQAKRYHIPAVLKGVVNQNFNQTLFKIFTLNRTIQAPILINPVWFQTFHITRVPALVVLASDTDLQTQHAQSIPFDVLLGAVSVRSGLEEISTHGTTGRITASNLLKRERSG